MTRGSLPSVFENYYNEICTVEVKKVSNMTANFSDVLFIGGTGRSGTTIAGKLLSRHHLVQAAKPIEIKFLTSGNGLLDLYRNSKISRTGKITIFPNSNVKRFLNGVEEKWWIRDGKKGGTTGLMSGIEREVWEALVEKLIAELRDDRKVACQNFFRGFVDYQKNSEKKIWLDTTPPNLMRAAEISKLLPGSHFLHMVRDGRDVASSVVREKWGPTDHFAALEWWRGRLLQIIKETQVVGGSVLHIWMEDLVENNRDQSLRKILEFLTLHPDVKLRRYFETTLIPASGHIGRWRREVANHEKFDARYQEILDELYTEGLARPASEQTLR